MEEGNTRCTWRGGDAFLNPMAASRMVHPRWAPGQLAEPVLQALAEDQLGGCRSPLWNIVRLRWELRPPCWTSIRASSTPGMGGGGDNAPKGRNHGRKKTHLFFLHPANWKSLTNGVCQHRALKVVTHALNCTLKQTYNQHSFAKQQCNLGHLKGLGLGLLSAPPIFQIYLDP